MSLVSADLDTRHNFVLISMGSSLLYRCKNCLLSYSSDKADLLQNQPCSETGF